jgi:hypothetical protein
MKYHDGPQSHHPRNSPVAIVYTPSGAIRAKLELELELELEPVAGRKVDADPLRGRGG